MAHAKTHVKLRVKGGSESGNGKRQLGGENWVRAGLTTLASRGIDAVRVEVLARDLGVSKGSFYWHFSTRDELLTAMLDSWERGEVDWLANRAEQGEAAERWGRLVEMVAGSGYSTLAAGVLDWSQRDPKVAERVREVETKRVGYIAEVLREIGFESREAEWWGEAVYLLYLGWVNRAQRNEELREAPRTAGNFLSRLVLAAAALEGQSATRPRKK